MENIVFFGNNHKNRAWTPIVDCLPLRFITPMLNTMGNTNENKTQYLLTGFYLHISLQSNWGNKKSI